MSPDFICGGKILILFALQTDVQLHPFPFTIENLEKTDNIQAFVKTNLQQNGLTRYINRISRFFAANYQVLQKENRNIITDLVELKGKDSKIEERIVADGLAEKFDGFGPK